MLRVRTLYACSAVETARYYTRYLDDPSEEPGCWRGRQADGLGLAGTVDTDQLESLLRGFHPVGGQRLGSALVDRFKADGTTIKAVAGYDATFSAPKSLSVWWALTGDRGLLDAHDTAVDVVLDHLEAEGATTRIRRNGSRAFVDTGGLTMAGFAQSTSREDDPQIHTHVVISTKVQADDGRWYALDARYLKRKQRALGGLYQSVLRAELTHRYGVAWGPISEGQAELAAMPTALIECFSKRARQVEEYLELKVMAFREMTGRDPTRYEKAALVREAAADSRVDKTGSPTGDLAETWRVEAAEIGWTAERLVSTLTSTGPVAEPGPVRVDELLDALTAEASTWLPIDVLRRLCDRLPPVPSMTGREWAAHLNEITSQLVEAGEDLDPDPRDPVRESDGRSIWIEPIKANLTHRAVLDQEERIIDFATTANETVPAPSSSGSVDTSGLDALQGDAARAVAGTDPLVLIVGPAGTGKTTTLARAVADLHRTGRPCFGVAPTAKAARVLGTETAMACDTVAKLLHEWDRPDGPRQPHRLAGGTTLVVDEAGMVGTDSLDRLLGLARTNRWRVVLVGDPQQLHAVGRGGMFDELCRSHRHHQLATIHRFTHLWEQEASLRLRSAQPEVIDSYRHHGRITAATLNDHLHTVGAAWVDHHQAGRRVAVTAETNAQVDSLNEAIQAHRRTIGALDPTRVVNLAGTETAGVGDLVVSRRNDRTLRTHDDQPIRNRELWKIEAIHRDGGLTVTRVGTGGAARLPGDYVAANVRLGYAATAHGHQGDTTDISYTLAAPGITHRSLYVGATRARDHNHLLVVTDGPDLDQARDVLEQVLATDRADIPATGRRRELHDQIPGDGADPLARAGQARAPRIDPLAEADHAYQDALDRLHEAHTAAQPFEQAVDHAQAVVTTRAQHLRDLEERARARRLDRLRLREPIRTARHDLAHAQSLLDQANADAQPARQRIEQADARTDRADTERQIQKAIRRLDEVATRPTHREPPGLSIG